MGKKPRLSKATAEKLVRQYVGVRLQLETVSQGDNLDWYEGRMGEIAVRVWNPVCITKGLYQIDIHPVCGSGGTAMLIDPVTLRRNEGAEDKAWLAHVSAIVDEWIDSVGAVRAHKTVDSRVKEVACG